MSRNSMMRLAATVFAFVLCTAGAMAQDSTDSSGRPPMPKPVPKEIRGGMLNSRANELPMPEYPEDARSRGIGGKVIVDVTVDEMGQVITAEAQVQDLKLIDNPERERRDQDPLSVSLKRAAEDAARMARFSPTMLNGTPVKVTGTLVYVFDAETGKVVSAPRDISGGVLNGRAESLPDPEYPPAAKAVRAEGQVTVKIQIGPDGTVIYASAVSGHPLLRQAAEAAARAAKFAPTTLEGKPVTVTGVLTYHFVLPKKDDQ